MSDITAARLIDPRVEIGQVHLEVADDGRALRFYREVLGPRRTGRRTLLELEPLPHEAEATAR